MRSLFITLVLLHVAYAQGTVPTFQYSAGDAAYTLAGHDPAQESARHHPGGAGALTISFEARKVAGQRHVMDAAADVPRVLRSPVFSKFAFPSGGTTQYADAMLRTTFPKADGWHTLLGKPEVKPVKITVPVGYGYILTSKKTGGSFAVVDVEFLQKELFKQIPKQEGKLVIAVTHNTTYYALGDATVCCSWGTHGVDSATGNSFVLGSYLHAAPAVVEDGDVQPLTQQLAEFINDPLHDPLLHGRNVKGSGKRCSRLDASASCVRATRAVAAARAWRPPTSFSSPPIRTRKTISRHRRLLSPMRAEPAYHLQNVALLPWYTGAAEDLGSSLQLPGRAGAHGSCQAVPGARRTPQRVLRRSCQLRSTPRLPLSGSPNGHQLIGYWAGYGAAGSTFPLREVSPQWDVIIVAFSTPDKNAPEGTMQFHTPAGLDTAAVQGRHRVPEEPGQEGDDLARRRRPALHARRSEARSELRLLGHPHRHRVRLRRHRHRLRKPVALHRSRATRTSSIPPRRRS